MTNYSVERWNDIVEELRPFAQIHWEQVALNHNEVPLDMWWERYEEMDNNGVLHVVTARSEGKLIGYHISLISGHLHYKSTLHAMVDLYYILPEHRTGRTPIKLFKFVEESLLDIGVVKIITGTKKHLDQSRLFEFLGYSNTEVIFTKIIKRK